MTGQGNDLLEILLRDCAARGAEPWYPSVYAQATGVPREMLEASLDRLRLGGLLRLTDWVQGKGQGYALTPEGARFLENPRLMQRLRQEGIEPQPLPPLTRPVDDYRPTAWDRGEAVRQSLLNPVRPRVTMTLVGLNLLVFFYGLYLASQKNLMENYLTGGGQAFQGILGPMGALNRIVVFADGQWWRVLAYAFLHGGLLHLGLNMYFLYSAGPLVETLWGSGRYFLLYFGSILGGAAGALFSTGLCVGASGALCGLFSSIGVWVILNRPYLPPALTAQWLRNLMINVFLLVFISMLPNVSGLAHLGGAFAGVAIGIPLVYSRYAHGLPRFLGWVGTMAALAACVGALTLSRTGQETLRIILLQVEKNALEDVYKIHVKPLMKKEENELFADPAAIKEAVQASTGALEELQRADQQLGALSFSDPATQNSLETAKEYVAAWTRFYRSVREILLRGTPWSTQEYRSLERNLLQTQELTKKLHDSLFSR